MLDDDFRFSKYTNVMPATTLQTPNALQLEHVYVYVIIMNI